jgi:NTE family protein
MVVSLATHRLLPTGVPCTLEQPPRGAFAIAVHALNLLAMRQLRSDVERYSERCELVVIPSLCPLAVHAYDFSHTGELIDRAEASTRLWLRGGLDNRDALTALLPHRHQVA